MPPFRTIAPTFYVVQDLGEASTRFEKIETSEYEDVASLNEAKKKELGILATAIRSYRKGEEGKQYTLEFDLPSGTDSSHYGVFFTVGDDKKGTHV